MGWFTYPNTGSKIKLGSLTYDPPRNGPTLWEIGIPDRHAAEFYVPDTYPTLMNKLYTSHPTDKLALIYISPHSCYNFHPQHITSNYFSLTDLGNTDCGNDTLIYILTMISFT